MKIERSGTSPQPEGPNSENTERLKSAVEQFEGMLLAQMLQSVRESALSGWQEEKDQTSATMLEMAEGQMARLMASQGGMGLSKLLQGNLQKQPAEMPERRIGGSKEKVVSLQTPIERSE